MQLDKKKALNLARFNACLVLWGAECTLVHQADVHHIADLSLSHRHQNQCCSIRLQALALCRAMRILHRTILLI